VVKLNETSNIIGLAYFKYNTDKKPKKIRAKFDTFEEYEDVLINGNDPTKGKLYSHYVKKGKQFYIIEQEDAPTIYFDKNGNQVNFFDVFPQTKSKK